MSSKNKTRKLLAAATLIGLEALVSGCVFSLDSQNKGLINFAPQIYSLIQHPVERFVTSKEDPTLTQYRLQEHQEKYKDFLRGRDSIGPTFDGLQYLGMNGFKEYVIPTEVMKAIDFSLGATDTHSAGRYLTRLTESQKRKFKQKLQNQRLNTQDQMVYFSLFSTPHSIIYDQQIFSDGSFQYIIPHERAHLIFDQALSEYEKDFIRDAYEDLLNQSFQVPNDRWRDFNHAFKNHREFVATLVEGKLPMVEKALRHGYPKVHKMFKIIKTRSSLPLLPLRTNDS